MIEVKNVYFEYPGFLALDDISFTIKKGDITALVGPNGAGKTTLLRCLAALYRPISGSIIIDGIDVQNDPEHTHRRVGYLSDFFGLYDALTVEQNLVYMASAHGIIDSDISSSVIRAAERLDIQDRLKKKAGSLSRGLRQRLAVAMAIVHEPSVVMLDEPASGLDPEARHSLSNLFLNLRKQGMTLIVSSHILSELEDYSTDMLVLQKGKIVLHKNIDIGKNDANAVSIKIVLSRPFVGLKDLLGQAGEIESVQMESEIAYINFRGGADEQHRLLKMLIDRGAPVSSFSVEKTDMHDAYLKTVRTLKDEGVADV